MKTWFSSSSVLLSSTSSSERSKWHGSLPLPLFPMLTSWLPSLPCGFSGWKLRNARFVFVMRCMRNWDRWSDLDRMNWVLMMLRAWKRPIVEDLGRLHSLALLIILGESPQFGSFSKYGGKSIMGSIWVFPTVGDQAHINLMNYTERKLCSLR